MEQFVAVAVAHCVALLIPGVDFFLIARTAMTGGWRGATGVCLGIATANGIFITAAFSGVAVISNPMLLDAIQLAGGGFLVFAGIAFLRSKTRIDLGHEPNVAHTTWLRNCGLGVASGLLNPKNALFYVSIAAAVSATALERVLYGIWMFTIVLVWDVFVAVVIGSKRALARMSRILPCLTTIAGGVLVVFGGGMITSLAVRYLLQA
ncbi:LysE family translocator [Saccharomonospora sp. NPDC006951]